MKNYKRTLTVYNLAQKILFIEMFIGQISDGQWENTRPHDHYKDWGYDLNVEVDAQNPGRNFHPIKCNYNLTTLLQYDWFVAEAIEVVVKATGNTAYDKKALRKDVRELKTCLQNKATAKATTEVVKTPALVTVTPKVKYSGSKRTQLAKRLADQVGGEYVGRKRNPKVYHLIEKKIYLNYRTVGVFEIRVWSEDKVEVIWVTPNGNGHMTVSLEKAIALVNVIV